jgi:hypothetical protein
MSQSPLIRDVRRLRKKTLRQDQIKDLQDDLCGYLTALIPPYETCDELIGRRGSSPLRTDVSHMASVA